MAAEMPKQKKTGKVPQTHEEKSSEPHLVIVLEQAAIEVVKTKKVRAGPVRGMAETNFRTSHFCSQGFELLNSDDHAGIHRKYKKDPADSRPDVLHQCLLTLLDSPLNKAGKLQVYVETKNRTLIEISPHTRIPRTYKRFAGLMGTLKPTC